MSRFPFLAQRILNVPIAIHAPKAEIIVAALAERLGIAKVEYDGEVIVGASNFYYSGTDENVKEDDKGYDVKDGVAIIQVTGTLVHKNGTLRPTSGMMGYDGIRKNFITALEDPAVKAIAFDIDSPGGEVSGCFDLVDTIYQARGEKPIISILSEYAFSAAYAIASAADHITVPRTGGTGSIGVVAMHVDYSKQLDEQGLKVTLIQFGSKKTDGSETTPLSDAARERIQADVDELGEMFVSTVARNRNLNPKAIRAQQAGVYLGAAGIEQGLADELCAPHDALASLIANLK